MLRYVFKSVVYRHSYLGNIIMLLRQRNMILNKFSKKSYINTLIVEGNFKSGKTFDT